MQNQIIFFCLQKVVVIYNIDVSELSYKMYKADNKILRFSEHYFSPLLKEI